jgi:hypothetical protein
LLAKEGARGDDGGAAYDAQGDDSCDDGGAAYEAAAACRDLRARRLCSAAAARTTVGIAGVGTGGAAERAMAE